MLIESLGMAQINVMGLGELQQLGQVGASQLLLELWIVLSCLQQGIHALARSFRRRSIAVADTPELHTVLRMRIERISLTEMEIVLMGNGEEAGEIGRLQPLLERIIALSLADEGGDARMNHGSKP